MSTLEARRMKKKKQPDFIRQDAHKRARLKKNWRRPKGSNSKMRQNLKGYRRNVSAGWGSPKEVRGLSREGLKIVHISQVTELEKIDKTKEGVIIQASVGARRKIEMLKKAQDMGITVLNIKDPSGFVKNKEDGIKKRQEAKKKRVKVKEEKKKKKEEKKEKKTEGLGEKVKKIEEKTEKERKDEEKKDKDKVLIDKKLQ